MKEIEEYIKKTTWRINENANANWGHSGLYSHISGTIMAKYALEKIYPKDISTLHKEGSIYIHDLSFPICPYCCGFSSDLILEKGLYAGRQISKPAKHLDSAVNQLINFVFMAATEFSGASAYSFIDRSLAPFIRKDDLSYNEVKQHMQSFIHGVDMPLRASQQTPFFNISLKWTDPDYQNEMDMINKAILEIMIDGNPEKKPFTFPIPTYAITKDFNWESDNVFLLAELTAKYGSPYFQNFCGSGLNPDDIYSMCCRLSIDMKQLHKGSGGRFSSFPQTGSIGIVSLNMAQLGFVSKNYENLIENLDSLLDKIKETLVIKREIIDERLHTGFFPICDTYLKNFDNHFLTIGVVGMNEMCLNFLDETILGENGYILALDVLAHINQKLIEFQEETGYLFNLEQTPAEGCSYKLAQIDYKKFGGVSNFMGDGDYYYSNSSHIPVNYDIDIIDALIHQEKLNEFYTGGTTFHIWMGEQMSKGGCISLIQKICNNSTIPYFDITPTYSICSDHGYFFGAEEVCPKCGKKTAIYSRVTGYLRDVNTWNIGKKAEFKDRKMFRTIK